MTNHGNWLMLQAKPRQIAFATPLRPSRPPRPMSLHEQAEWTYLGEPLAPLKGYPGVMWERPGRRKRRGAEGMF